MMEPRYKFKRAVKLAGSQSKLAEMVGCTRQAVAQWDRQKDIPELYAWRLHQILKEQSE